MTTKWQYAISRLLVQVPLYDKEAAKACDIEILNNMNGMGNDGWELCTASSESSDEKGKILIVQFWKRPKP